jgi:pimeloyl-ACP methyl ester carboxylesterase
MRRIGFVTAPDGLGLAYGVHGSGPAIVKAANWMTHLEHDWQSPVWRHWLEFLGEHHTVLRYDERGCGLSDRDVEDDDAFTFERWVADLEAVVDAAAVDRFALLGISQGAALAIAYAVRHPERVSQLVLYGGYARGRARRDQASASSPTSSCRPSASAGDSPTRPSGACSRRSTCRTARPSR